MRQPQSFIFAIRFMIQIIHFGLRLKTMWLHGIWIVNKLAFPWPAICPTILFSFFHAAIIEHKTKCIGAHNMAYFP